MCLLSAGLLSCASGAAGTQSLHPAGMPPGRLQSIQACKTLRVTRNFTPYSLGWVGKGLHDSVPTGCPVTSQ